MYLLKKLFFVLALTVVALKAQGPQDTIRIVTVMDKALETGLSSIKNQISKENLQARHIIERELAGISIKFAYAFKNDLTNEERFVVVDLLHDLKNLSETTTADLLLMTESCSSYERRDAINKAIEKYFPEFNKKQASIKNKEDHIALLRELEKVDLHDPSLNASTKFMCQCSYLEKYFFDASQNSCTDKIAETSLLKGCIEHLTKTIAVPFVVFNDFYFFPGWEDQFKQVGDTFAIVHMVCDKLLQAIDQK